MIGIEFTLEDGTKDWYDPVDLDSWKETERSYTFTVNATDYALLKEDVKSIRHYELCPKCGYELYKVGCQRCGVKAEKE